jgi:hypothetical protein
MPQKACRACPDQKSGSSAEWVLVLPACLLFKHQNAPHGLLAPMAIGVVVAADHAQLFFFCEWDDHFGIPFCGDAVWATFGAAFERFFLTFIEFLDFLVGKLRRFSTTL